MGLAVQGDRLAVGTALEIWEFHNVPAVARKLSTLTPRQLRVLVMLAEGQSNRRIADNLAIELNVMRAALASGVKKLLFLASSCMSSGVTRVLNSDGSVSRLTCTSPW